MSKNGEISLRDSGKNKMVEGTLLLFNWRVGAGTNINTGIVLKQR